MRAGKLALRTLLEPECIRLDAAVPGREQALEEVGRVLEQRHGVPSRMVASSLWKRERRLSTAVGHGVALPHAEVPGLPRPVAVFVRVRNPVAFDAPDRLPVRDVLALLVPRPATAIHFDLLTHYRRLLADEAFRGELARCSSEGQVWRLFEQHEWR